MRLHPTSVEILRFQILCLAGCLARRCRGGGQSREGGPHRVGGLGDGFSRAPGGSLIIWNDSKQGMSSARSFKLFFGDEAAFPAFLEQMGKTIM